MYKIYKCKYCGKEFDSPTKLGGHISRCKFNPNYKEYMKKYRKTKSDKNPIVEFTRKCDVCGEEYTLFLKQSYINRGKYKRTCSDKCSKILTINNTDKKIKNKKISDSINLICEKLKLSKPPKIKHCEYCGEQFQVSQRGHSRFCSDGCRKKYTSNKISKKVKGKTGGYRPLSGNKYHKSGEYDGIYFDSSWELAFYVYYKDFNKNIKRCDIERNYLYNGKCYKYIPDFITDDGIIEIKGYLTDKSKEKISQNPDVIVLYRSDVEPYIKYVVEKYGKNFWDKFYIEQK